MIERRQNNEKENKIHKNTGVGADPGAVMQRSCRVWTGKKQREHSGKSCSREHTAHIGHTD